jgi:tetratricopeptide (TPR) repeat protein
MGILLWLALASHSHSAGGERSDELAEVAPVPSSAGAPSPRPLPAPANPAQPAQPTSGAAEPARAPSATEVHGSPAAANLAGKAPHEPTQPSKRDEAGPEPVAVPARIVHLSQAREAFNARDWPRALSEGKNAVAAGGGADAQALLGNTYFKMGRFADAEAAYGKAIALDPGNRLLKDRLHIARARAQEPGSRTEP